MHDPVVAIRKAWQRFLLESANPSIRSSTTVIRDRPACADRAEEQEFHPRQGHRLVARPHGAARQRHSSWTIPSRPPRCRRRVTIDRRFLPQEYLRRIPPIRSSSRALRKACLTLSASSARPAARRRRSWQSSRRTAFAGTPVRSGDRCRARSDQFNRHLQAIDSHHNRLPETFAHLRRGGSLPKATRYSCAATPGVEVSAACSSPASSSVRSSRRTHHRLPLPRPIFPLPLIQSLLEAHRALLSLRLDWRSMPRRNVSGRRLVDRWKLAVSPSASAACGHRSCPQEIVRRPYSASRTDCGTLLSAEPQAVEEFVVSAGTIGQAGVIVRW